jgi:hypothetical protein
LTVTPRFGPWQANYGRPSRPTSLRSAASLNNADDVRSRNLELRHALLRPRDQDDIGFLARGLDFRGKLFAAIDVTVPPDFVAGLFEHVRQLFHACAIAARVAKEDAPHPPSGVQRLRLGLAQVNARASEGKVRI